MKIYGMWEEIEKYWYTAYADKYPVWSFDYECLLDIINRGINMEGFVVEEMPCSVIATIPEAATATIAFYNLREASARMLLAEAELQIARKKLNE